MHSSSFSSVMNCTVSYLDSQSLLEGIHLSESEQSLVKFNNVTYLASNSYVLPLVGITIESSEYISVVQNRINTLNATFSDVQGISISTSDIASITNNSVQVISTNSGTAVGIKIISSDSTTISDNTIDDISSGEASPPTYKRLKNRISVFDIFSYGLFLEDCDSALLESNSVSDTDMWLHFDETSPNIELSENIVDSQNMTLVSAVRPDDLTFDYGTTGNIISWTIQILHLIDWK